MIRISVFLPLLLLLAAPLAHAASAPPANTDPATFRWTLKCNEISTPHITVCRIIPEVAQGVIYRGPFVPVTFQLDNRKGRTISLGGDQICLAQPAILRFGKNPPYTLRTTDSLSGAVFDRIVAEFRAAKSATVEYSPMPDCKRVSARFYYSNLDDMLAKATAEINAGGS